MISGKIKKEDCCSLDGYLKGQTKEENEEGKRGEEERWKQAVETYTSNSGSFKEKKTEQV